MNDRNDQSFSDDSTLISAGATNRGRVRETNQDQFLIAQLKKSMLVDSTSLDFEQQVFGNLQSEILLVADGMGGHAAGEKASQLAIQYLVRRLLNSIHWFSQHEEDERREDAFITDLKDLLKDAHQRILRESAQHRDRRGMGTTLTMAHLVGSRMYVVHAGDSRCYLLRDGKAKQITTDHTLAHQMVEAGGMKPEDEASSKWSNVLWNVLGGNSDGDIIAEVHRVDLKVGDAVVLCSDGLYRYIDNDALAAVVIGSQSPETACRELIALANQQGGEDNITVVVACPGAASLRTTRIEHYGTTSTGSCAP
ncbi:MAG: protein phosphatase 2C domain-containing protein [Rubripirellula sp.]|nr:protein phosphatase 2C domain-containing protein [Rubripirellula sp.]